MGKPAATKLRITSRVDGRRRAGMRHSAEPAYHELDRFDESQLEILRSDPDIMVDKVQVDPDTNEPVGATPAAKAEPDARIVPIAKVLGVDAAHNAAAFVDAIVGLKADAAEPDPRVAPVATALGVKANADAKAFVDAIRATAEALDREVRRISAIAEALGVADDAEVKAFIDVIGKLKAVAADANAGGKGESPANGGTKKK